ncbi:putative monooxygenase [Mycena maculata]|uniref:Monooxygenase n=1 Tax=Mycena maculata TaxID=230809 RepID=A0AAD7IPT0_9AGAR|nr:putative monooxygenase [Mycena maculata]
MLYINEESTHRICEERSFGQGRKVEKRKRLRHLFSRPPPRCTYCPKSCSRRSKDRLPPGPLRLPLLGSVLQIPREYPWLTFSQWAKTHGRIIYADALGQPLIVINSAEVARELLDQRSDSCGYREPFILQQYGDNWRQQRKIVAQDFSQNSITCYHSLQEKEAKKLALGILDDPSTLLRQLKLRLGTIIIRVTFGYYLKDENDRFLTSPLTAMDNFSKATAAGVWVESGNVLLPNMCSTVLEEVDRNPFHEQEDQLVWAASAVMGAGLDSNTSTLLIFFLAMTLNPAVQAKARQEIEDVIGRDMLPTIKDKGSLPYIRSIMTEILWWHPAVPLGLPHALNKDDIYEGMHLPKGSIMIANVWYMLHDPKVFPNPDEFDPVKQWLWLRAVSPDRYKNLDSEMDKVTDLVFRFGRRVCPGKFFGEATFFAIVSTVLSTCEILQTVDDKGSKIIPIVTFSSGTIIFPSALEVDIKCWSEKACEMLSRGLADII